MAEPPRLRVDPPVDELCRRGVQPDLARREEIRSRADGLRVRADRRRSRRRRDRPAIAHACAGASIVPLKRIGSGPTPKFVASL